MGDPGETHAVDGQDLVSPFEPAVLGGGAPGEHRLDVDGQVAVWTAVAADDGEAQPIGTSLQGDLFRARAGTTAYTERKGMKYISLHLGST